MHYYSEDRDFLLHVMNLLKLTAKILHKYFRLTHTGEPN